MSELVLVLEDLVREAEAGRPSALCTLVRTRGSTPQSAGAAMLVRSDYATTGTLGGGCVEAEVRRRAFELLERRQSAQLEFVLDHDYGWDDGLICGGKMTVAVMPITEQTNVQPFRSALDRYRARQLAEFAVRVEHEGSLLEYRINLEVPPRLLIAGAGHVGRALAKLAVDLDFHVVVFDDRADMASLERFGPRVERRVGEIADELRAYPIDRSSYVVIVTRGHSRDHQALHAVVEREAAYVGLIGSRRKSRMIFDDLVERGVPAERLQRVHTPIGLGIGAVTVSEIAVSIAAELVQVRRQFASEPPVVGRVVVAGALRDS